MHRFLSPNWYEVLKQHLAGANSTDPGNENTLFRTIVGLRTGQALLFCPTAQMDIHDESPHMARWPRSLDDDYVNIRVRKRLTADGGKSIMAADIYADSVPDEPDEIPMFVVNKGEKANQKGDGSTKQRGSPKSWKMLRKELIEAASDEVDNSDNQMGSEEEPLKSVISGNRRVMSVLDKEPKPPSKQLVEALQRPIYGSKSPTLLQVIELTLHDTESLN